MKMVSSGLVYSHHLSGLKSFHGLVYHLSQVPSDGSFEEKRDEPQQHPTKKRLGVESEGSDDLGSVVRAIEFPRLFEFRRQLGQRRRKLLHCQPDSAIGLPFDNLFNMARPIQVRYTDSSPNDIRGLDIELRNLDAWNGAVPVEVGPLAQVENLQISSGAKGSVASQENVMGFVIGYSSLLTIGSCRRRC